MNNEITQLCRCYRASSSPTLVQWQGGQFCEIFPWAKGVDEPKFRFMHLCYKSEYTWSELVVPQLVVTAQAREL